MAQLVYNNRGWIMSAVVLAMVITLGIAVGWGLIAVATALGLGWLGYVIVGVLLGITIALLEDAAQ